MSKKCLGCGVTLQNENKEIVGYTDANRQYCRACFVLKNYGKATSHIHPALLPEIKEKSLVLIISSVLQLDSLSNPLSKDNDYLSFVYIINQIDLLPQHTNKDYLLEHIVKQFVSNKIEYEDIILMSAKNKKDIVLLKDYLLNSGENNVCLVGIQNSGKTTLFNALTGCGALAINKAALTQEPLVGYLENIKITDMPGLYKKGQLHEIIEFEDYKNLIPTNKINPILYQMNVSNTIFIEGLCAISYLKGTKKTFAFYLSKHSKTLRTTYKNISKFIDNKERFKVYAKEYHSSKFSLSSNIKYQITLADLGVVHIEGPGLVEVLYPKGLAVTIMEAYFK